MAEEEPGAGSAGEYPPMPGEAAVDHEGLDAAAGEEAGFRALAAELFGALRDAGMAILEAHKQLAAEQTAEIADTVQRFGRSVDQTQSRLIDRYCDRAAARIAAAARSMRERGWGEIAADAEAFAQRRPALFIFAALGTGFAAGRLLLAAAERERRRAAAAAASMPQAGAAPPAQHVEGAL